jgi:ATP-dependent DNA helicase RecG
VKENGRITNKEYQILNNTSDRTALRDLENLIAQGLFMRVGEKKGAYYELLTLYSVGYVG